MVHTSLRAAVSALDAGEGSPRWSAGPVPTSTGCSASSRDPRPASTTRPSSTMSRGAPAAGRNSLVAAATELSVLRAARTARDASADVSFLRRFKELDL